MRLLPLLLLATLPAASLLVSGCLDCLQSGPPVTARGISPAVDSEAGLTGFALTIRVTAEPGGPPLPGAGVVAYWARDSPAEWRQAHGGSVEIHGEGGSVHVAVPDAAFPATPESKSTERMRTNGSGEVVVKVPPDRIVGIVAAADGWTEEWVPAIATGGRGESDVLTLPLYRSRLSAHVNGTWGPGAASSGRVTGNNYEWEPSSFPFGETEEARRGYAERIVALSARLTWENGVNGVGDLAIGLGPTREQPTYVHDEETDAVPGGHAEEFYLEAFDLKRYDALGSPDAQIGPATGVGYAGPFGLPYALALEARFDPALAAQADCAVDVQESGGGLPGASVPGPGVLALLALLPAGALLTPRRR